MESDALYMKGGFLVGIASEIMPQCLIFESK